MFVSFVIAVPLVGCSVRVVHVDDADASTMPVPEDAGADNASAEGCHCAFHWQRIVTPSDPPILCYPRGSCAADVVCVPVLPYGEQPACTVR